MSITIYCGDNLADLHEHVAPIGGALVFEDRFKDSTWFEYGNCWPLLLNTQLVICKTKDAILAAPLDSRVIKIGRSVRSSNQGQIIEHSMSLETFKTIF